MSEQTYDQLKTELKLTQLSNDALQNALADAKRVSKSRMRDLKTARARNAGLSRTIKDLREEAVKMERRLAFYEKQLKEKRGGE